MSNLTRRERAPPWEHPSLLTTLALTCVSRTSGPHSPFGPRHSSSPDRRRRGYVARIRRLRQRVRDSASCLCRPSLHGTSQHSHRLRPLPTTISLVSSAAICPRSPSHTRSGTELYAFPAPPCPGCSGASSDILPTLPGVPDAR